ncbi:Hypothetical predicted protein [Pelobates cultripes]|uniref:L1 transposable element RRM domain-containing protein n=1 Tax=Pelobates cultripes TaxID=61616 RepID=A0AAD1WUF4_PELCU|nr:Hypothetical predicted protein [Pelobates cultripes]
MEEVENRLHFQEQSYLDLVDRVKTLQKQVNQQAEKLEDAEDRSRHNNLRMEGIPDNIDTAELPNNFQTMVRAVKLTATNSELLLDHIHRLPKPSSATTAVPKDVIVRFHDYHIKEEFLVAVRMSGLSGEFQSVTSELCRRGIRYRWGFPVKVTVEEVSYLAHPTRDRAKIQHSRRPPTRGHLMAVASTSTSDGMLTLDLIQEEDVSPEDQGSCDQSFRVDLDKSVAQLASNRRRSDSENLKSSERGKVENLHGREHALWEKTGVHRDSFGKGTTYTPQVPKKLSYSEKNKCASMEEILSRSNSSGQRPTPKKTPEAEKLSCIQELIGQKIEKTQELLTEVKDCGEGKKKGKEPCKVDSEKSENALQEAERLLGEASSNWRQARKVLQEIKELRDLYRQAEQQAADPKQKLGNVYRKSLM